MAVETPERSILGSLSGATPAAFISTRRLICSITCAGRVMALVLVHVLVVASEVAGMLDLAVVVAVISTDLVVVVVSTGSAVVLIELEGVFSLVVASMVFVVVAILLPIILILLSSLL